jgi:folate-binding protein YgfZ
LEEFLLAQPSLAGTWALEALRVAAGIPRMGFETDHKTLPHEVGWIGPGVHLAKGCYRGQETVARVHNLGRPPRRLVLLHLDGSVEQLPAKGDAVISAGRQVGVVGTVARHYELGPIASAVVKRNTDMANSLEVVSEGNPGAIFAATGEDIVVAG